MREKVRKPVFFIEYEQKDITTYITPFVLSVTYTDYEHGKSDEIEIQLEDSDARWKSSWYPTKGDILRLRIGYESEGLLDCGGFEIDEIELASPPDTVSLKGLATNIKKALRQSNTTAYEDKTLKQIVNDIASKHGFEVVGEIKDIKVKRITQKQERDISFLKRIAEDYGHVFKITDNKLVFYELDKLESTDTVFVIDRKEMLSFNLKDKTYELYKACEVSYHDPKLKRIITHSVKAENITSGDVLKINERCESKEQAIAKASSALSAKNKLQTEGTVTVIGNQRLVAGLNIELTGLYTLSGKYHINESKHTISRSAGYKTELGVRRVA